MTNVQCTCEKMAAFAALRKDFMVLFVGSMTAIFLYVFFGQIGKPLSEIKNESWPINLLLNLCSYSVLVLSGMSVFRYAKFTYYFEECKEHYLCSLLKSCFYGRKEKDGNGGSAMVFSEEDKVMSDTKVCLHLFFCFFGLLGSYLTWGLLQEKIMTKRYGEQDQGQYFSDSQFLVFVNRILAVWVAAIYLWLRPQPIHRAPMYKYSYCSFSNIMSSWCQYEALKYISFPTQVLVKASKIIPVMVMSWIISRKSYEKYEYLLALLISLGMVLFLFGSPEAVDSGSGTSSTTFSGFLLLFGYVTCDAFTSNWQKELFNSYNMTSVQAMFGINLFSCCFTIVSLLQQQSLYSSLLFMSQFPQFCLDCIVLSLCSALGQLFIFHTINTFDPVVFIIIMTLRQACAILLSCVIYGHAVTKVGSIGVLLVFAATFLNVFFGYYKRRQKS